MIQPRGLVYRNRPKAYSSDGMTVGGHNGVYIANRPRKYPRTAPQKRVAAIAAECGIKKGISRRDLRQKMVDCVGPKMRK